MGKYLVSTFNIFILLTSNLVVSCAVITALSYLSQKGKKGIFPIVPLSNVILTNSQVLYFTRELAFDHVQGALFCVFRLV